MKRILTVIFIIIGLGFAGLARAEEINNFGVVINVNKDSSINVTERVEYNFDGVQKHGIFRDIPIKYQARGGNYNLRISKISVTDENGQPYKYTISYPGKNLEIKIGDADKLVTGVKTYVISYTVDRAINYFSDHDELYWNATGNGWQVAINKASVKIIFSDFTVDSKNIQAACYMGVSGNQNPCLSHSFTNNNAVLFNQGYLSPGEGLTAVLGLPKGTIFQPTQLQNVLLTLQDNLILGLPILVLIGLILYWYKFGRDPKGRGVIIAQFDPPDKLSPAEVGTIIDEKAESRDISAQIIDLAIKGYLKIIRTENGVLFKQPDYTFHKLKEPDDLSNDFDKKLMEAMFESGKIVNLSVLKTKIYSGIAEVIKMIYANTYSKGYFVKNPNTVRIIFSVIGAFFTAGGILLGKDGNILAAISVFISGVMIVVLGFIMPRRSEKGVLAKEHILGLKIYLTVAEKDRINFHNAPEKNPEQFEKLLPYAMVLGVEKQWAKQFEGIYTQNPNWYNDSSGANFSVIAFASTMNNFSHTAGAVMATAPGGGSGFSGGGSGGGFGGGGGGSW
ncbi:MAG: DUF2207 domain-containing protein [Patescibacteria group bacterium]